MSQKCRKRIYGQTFVVLLYHLNNIEITNHFSYEPRFNGFFSRNNISRIKDGAYVINRDDENSTGTHWVSLFIDRNTAVYFDYFGIEYIPQEVLNKIKDQSITHNMFRIHNIESIMWILLYCFHGIYACRKNFVTLY